jgi:hypothetical protein
MILHLATPEHHTHFAQWRDCDRLERLTCAPLLRRIYSILRREWQDIEISQQYQDVLQR